MGIRAETWLERIRNALVSGVGSLFSSVLATFTIPNGQDGSIVVPVNLGAQYKILCIVCENCGTIAAATNMTAQVAYDNTGSPACTLYEQDDPSTQWSQGAIPVAGTLAFALTHAFGVRRIRLILSNNVIGDTAFKIYGVHGGS